MQRLVTAAEALELIGFVGVLHDAPDPATLLAAVPRLVGDLIAYDAIDLVGPAGTRGGGVERCDHRLAVATPDAGGVLGGLLLGRRSRPFTARDAALAGLIGPLLGAAADHVRLKALHANGREPLVRLTERERQVLALVAEGRSTRDIATRLYIEARTVEKHVEHIKSKLGARSRAQAAAAWARAAVAAS